MISAALSSASERPLMVAAARAWIEAHLRYSSSGMSRIAMQSVRRPSVAYSCNGKVRSVESAGGGLSGTHLEVVARRLAKELPLARERSKMTVSAPLQ